MDIEKVVFRQHPSLPMLIASQGNMLSLFKLTKNDTKVLQTIELGQANTIRDMMWSPSGRELAILCHMSKACFFKFRDNELVEKSAKWADIPGICRTANMKIPSYMFEDSFTWNREGTGIVLSTRHQQQFIHLAFPSCRVAEI